MPRKRGKVQRACMWPTGLCSNSSLRTSRVLMLTIEPRCVLQSPPLTHKDAWTKLRGEIGLMSEGFTPIRKPPTAPAPPTWQEEAVRSNNDRRFFPTQPTAHEAVEGRARNLAPQPTSARHVSSPYASHTPGVSAFASVVVSPRVPKKCVVLRVCVCTSQT